MTGGAHDDATKTTIEYARRELLRLPHALCLTSVALFSGCRDRPETRADMPSDAPPTIEPATLLGTQAMFVPLASGVAYARGERTDDRGRNTVWAILRVRLEDAN